MFRKTCAVLLAVALVTLTNPNNFSQLRAAPSYFPTATNSYNHLIEGDLNILLVVFQAVAAVVCVEFSKHMGWVDYPAFNLSTARSWAPVNIFFFGCCSPSRRASSTTRYLWSWCFRM